MKVTMYGAQICPDCVEAKEQLKDIADIELDYRNITESTVILKEFLSYRDHEPVFEEIKEGGKIGIPFFVLEDGRKTFDVTEFTDLSRDSLKVTPSACSLDGKGNC